MIKALVFVLGTIAIGALGGLAAGVLHPLLGPLSVLVAVPIGLLGGHVLGTYLIS